MADYKNIKGFNIQYLDSDPPNPIEGQMWFNSTTQTLKGTEAGGAPAGTWASGGNMNTGREDMGSTGTLTAGLVSAGYGPGGNVTNVESYNGTSWTEITDVNTARRALPGSGTQTATVVFGGDTTGNYTGITGITESWNGSAWTEVNDLNTARANSASSQAGTSTAALNVGGSANPSPVKLGNTESWNGTSWTEVNDLNTCLLYTSPSPRD